MNSIKKIKIIKDNMTMLSEIVFAKAEGEHNIVVSGVGPTFDAALSAAQEKCLQEHHIDLKFLFGDPISTNEAVNLPLNTATLLIWE